MFMLKPSRADGLALRDRLAGVPESLLGCHGLGVAEGAALRDQLAALTTSLELGSSPGPLTG
jgi:hypothetical protein